MYIKILISLIIDEMKKRRSSMAKTILASLSISVVALMMFINQVGDKYNGKNSLIPLAIHFFFLIFSAVTGFTGFGRINAVEKPLYVAEDELKKVEITSETIGLDSINLLELVGKKNPDSIKRDELVDKVTGDVSTMSLKELKSLCVYMARETSFAGQVASDIKENEDETIPEAMLKKENKKTWRKRLFR